ncbi:hypothetical protein [Sphingomonas sp. PWP1-2]
MGGSTNVVDGSVPDLNRRYADVVLQLPVRRFVEMGGQIEI